MSLFREMFEEFGLLRYSALFFWDTLYKESVVAGKALAGRLLVLDLSGISLAKGKRASDFVSKQMSAWPAKARSGDLVDIWSRSGRDLVEI